MTECTEFQRRQGSAFYSPGYRIWNTSSNARAGWVRPEEQQRWKHPAGARYDTIDRTQTEMRCKQRKPACKRSSLNRLEGLFSIFCFDAIWTNNPSRRFVLLHRKHRDRSWMTRQINPSAISASDAKKLQFVLGLWTRTPTHELSVAPLPRVVFLRAHWELPKHYFI